MTDIKSRVQDLEATTQPRDLKELIAPTGNIYETLAICSKRSKSLINLIRQELHGKLEEFAVENDTIEEIQENKEQIEISKFYEKLPNPAVISLYEFLHDELEWRYKDEEEKESEAREHNK